MTDSTDSSQEQTPPAAGPAPQYTAVHDSRRKSPMLACFLSLMPGLGQVYVGYYQRGFLHATVVAVLVTLLATDLEELIPLAGLFLAFFWLYNIIDAGRRAVLFNEVLAGRSDVEMPADFKMPALGGSVGGGVIIAAVGLVMLSKTAFDVSLDWLNDWWPAALVLFGAYLIYKAKKDQSVTSSASEWVEEE